MKLRCFEGNTYSLYTASQLHLEDDRWDTFLAANVAVVINCRDTMGLEGLPTPIPYYSANIVELDDWGYIPFYRAQATLLRFNVNKTRPAVFHCKAGRVRSVMMAVTQLLSVGDSVPDKELNHWKQLVSKGRIPHDILKFLELQRRFPKDTIQQLRKRLSV